MYTKDSKVKQSLFYDHAGSAPFIISYDPSEDENFQFSAVSHFLSSVGVHWSKRTMPDNIITAAHGTPLQKFHRSALAHLSLKMVHLVATSPFMLHMNGTIERLSKTFTANGKWQI